MTPFAMQPDAMIEALEAAGFDASYSDVLVARREQDTVWEVAIDNSGRLRATITYATEPASETTVPVLDREALVLVERSAMITVVLELQDAAELPDALAAIESVVANL
ncbi:MAG: hypothetical protein ACUVR3_05345 [Candidatus Roseilinea sp.]|uniref:hypothetical protein n=1 Tax=Candidatus Roseilinea sp. TaxID=2838777 RepID=UPI0040497175